MKRDYEDLIQRRKELQEELLHINSKLDTLKHTVFLGKLEKAENLIAEVANSGIYNGRIENEASYSLEAIAEFIHDYVVIIKRGE